MRKLTFAVQVPLAHPHLALPAVPPLVLHHLPLVALPPPPQVPPALVPHLPAQVQAHQVVLPVQAHQAVLQVQAHQAALPLQAVLPVQVPPLQVALVLPAPVLPLHLQALQVQALPLQAVLPVQAPPLQAPQVVLQVQALPPPVVHLHLVLHHQVVLAVVPALKLNVTMKKIVQDKVQELH